MWTSKSSNVSLRTSKNSSNVSVQLGDFTRRSRGEVAATLALPTLERLPQVVIARRKISEMQLRLYISDDVQLS